jgi:transposase-like protein
VAAALKTIWHQESAEEARHKATRVMEQYRGSLPAAMRTLEGALEDSLAFYAFPREHWKMLRTNNPLERLMKEIRRRTKVAEQFPHEESALLLVTLPGHAAAQRHGAAPDISGERRLRTTHLRYRSAFTHNWLRYRRLRALCLDM